jgi:hypothetical protein
LALASLVLVLGGSIGITSASYQALPNSALYPVKLWVEEYKAKNQKTPEAIIAFESKRIETRFNEATRLAVNQELDDSSSAIIQAGIEHSRTAIKNIAEKIQDKNPELALSAATTLETTFSSNGKILATIEQKTNQNTGPIVLAAQITTKTLATEKTKFEQIVALKSNDTTKESAEKRLDEVNTLLAKIPADIEPEQKPLATVTDTSVMTTAKLMVTATAPVVEPVTVQEKKPREKASDLIKDARSKMDVGLYSEALILLEKARQILSEITLTESLEQTYQVDVNASVETKTEAEIETYPAPRTVNIKETTQTQINTEQLVQ